MAPGTHKSHKVKQFGAKSGAGTQPAQQNALIYSLPSLHRGALWCKRLHHVWLPRQIRGGAQAVPVPPAAPATSQALSAQGATWHYQWHQRCRTSGVRDALSQSSMTLCSHASSRPTLRQSTFPFSQSFTIAFVITMGKYWLGSNRLKIFGLHQMWCVYIFETLAKGVIWGGGGGCVHFASLLSVCSDPRSVRGGFNRGKKASCKCRDAQWNCAHARAFLHLQLVHMIAEGLRISGEYVNKSTASCPEEPLKVCQVKKSSSLQDTFSKVLGTYCRASFWQDLEYHFLAPS